MFKIKNITKKYDLEYALKDVSITIGNGLNFIVGSSGSGKTTLLKIISGMDTAFDGEVLYDDQDIKSLTNLERSYYYNHVFGFIWQDFHLLEDSSVIENIMVPTLLKDHDDALKEAKQILRDMKLSRYADQKVKFLSGGQKQRVAIARELMKNPQVILADEPTSALDEKTSYEIMNILRMIAKHRSVIIVTHDTAFITAKDHVFELDKGELVEVDQAPVKKEQSRKLNQPYALSFKRAMSLTYMNIRRHFARFIISTITLMVAAVLLLTTFSGSIASSGKESFDTLLSTYGEGILDMSIVNSYMNASGTDGKETQKGEVSQDIAGLFEKYAKDQRIQFTLYMQAFNDITIDLDGKKQRIESSGSTPILNKLISGEMPKGEGNEVVVSKYYMEKSGYTKESILGKEITFSASIYNWDSGEPVAKQVNIKAKVVGVSDNKAVYEAEGKTYDYSVDDSFFFNKTALDSLRKQAGLKDGEINFTMRAKTPEDLIAIKDELNKKGIVPLGQFELVEDMVKLSNQTSQQSGSANIVIGLLGIVMTISIFTLINVMRKREIAIYKISGFGYKHLNLVAFTETLTQVIAAIILLILTSPVINIVTNQFLHVNILSIAMLGVGSGLVFGVSTIAYALAVMVMKHTDIKSTLKSGGR